MLESSQGIINLTLVNMYKQKFCHYELRDNPDDFLFGNYDGYKAYGEGL